MARLNRETAAALVGAGLLIAGVIPAAAAPAARQAAIAGTVVATDANRGTVTTANGRGEVATVRVGKTGHRYRLGQRIATRATRNPDGTWSASKVRALGRAKSVKVRAVVVHAVPGGYAVSAGSSTFRIRTAAARGGLRAHEHGAPATGLASGTVVVATLGLDGAAPVGRSLQPVGSVQTLELEGILLSADATTLEVAVAGRGRVTIAVPAGTTVAGTPGDVVEVLVSVVADGSFTLDAVNADGHGGSNDGGFQIDEEELAVEGVISELSPDLIRVAAGGSALGCVVPPALSLTGFAVGDRVEMHCTRAGAGFQLTELQSDTAHASDGEGDAVPSAGGQPAPQGADKGAPQVRRPGGRGQD